MDILGRYTYAGHGKRSWSSHLWMARPAPQGQMKKDPGELIPLRGLFCDAANGPGRPFGYVHYNAAAPNDQEEVELFLFPPVLLLHDDNIFDNKFLLVTVQRAKVFHKISFRS